MSLFSFFIVLTSSFYLSTESFATLELTEKDNKFLTNLGHQKPRKFRNSLPSKKALDAWITSPEAWMERKFGACMESSKESLKGSIIGNFPEDIFPKEKESLLKIKDHVNKIFKEKPFPSWNDCFSSDVKYMLYILERGDVNFDALSKMDRSLQSHYYNIMGSYQQTLLWALKDELPKISPNLHSSNKENLENYFTQTFEENPLFPEYKEIFKEIDTRLSALERTHRKTV